MEGIRGLQGRIDLGHCDLLWTVQVDSNPVTLVFKYGLRAQTSPNRKADQQVAPLTHH